MIEIEDDGGCDADGREEGVGATVIAHCDAPPILDLGEHVLDLVAGFVERLVVGEMSFPALGGRDARYDTPCFENGSEAIAIVASVGD